VEGETEQDLTLTCGDGLCYERGGEDASTCPQDCDYCGNGFCGGLEDYYICAKDCDACNNGYCGPYENENNCPQDCGDFCGNNYCGPEEDENFCPEDCSGCGNGICSYSEDIISCPQDCDVSFWAKTYDGAIGFSIQQTPDMGYIVAGFTGSDGAGKRDFYILKLDCWGNKIWDKAFGGAEDEEAFSIKLTPDDGYIVTGYTKSYGTGGSDIWIIKLDDLGNKIWDKTFGGDKNDAGYSVYPTIDNGFVILGYTSSYGVGGEDIWLIKLDAQGEKIWDKTFGDIDNDYGYEIKQTPDGEYIIAGSQGGKAWIIKLDSNGNKLWDKLVDSSKAFSISPTSDGGYIVAGANYLYDMDWILKLDASGNKIWESIFCAGHCSYCMYSRAYSVQQTSDGGYIITGYSHCYKQSDNVDIIKLNSQGKRVWTKTIIDPESHGTGKEVQQTTNGGYVIVGYSSDLLVIKMDKNGYFIK